MRPTPLDRALWLAALAAAVGEPVDLDALGELVERCLEAWPATASA